MNEYDVEPVEPRAQEGMLDRAHRAVIGIIEARRVRMSAGEAGRHHVAAGLGRLGEGVHDAADLGRHQDLVALGAPEPRAHPGLRQSVAVMRRRVEHFDPAGERLLDRRDRRFFVEQLIEVAKRPGPLADDGKRQPLAVPSLYASRFHVSSTSVQRRVAPLGLAAFGRLSSEPAA